MRFNLPEILTIGTMIAVVGIAATPFVTDSLAQAPKADAPELQFRAHFTSQKEAAEVAAFRLSIGRSVHLRIVEHNGEEHVDMLDVKSEICNCILDEDD